jgi:hypothetical protein
MKELIKNSEYIFETDYNLGIFRNDNNELDKYIINKGEIIRFEKFIFDEIDKIYNIIFLINKKQSLTISFDRFLNLLKDGIIVESNKLSIAV